MGRFTLVTALLAGTALAQDLDFGAIDAAPDVASGPAIDAVAATETVVSLYTDFAVTSAATAASSATSTASLASQLVRRDGSSASGCASTSATCTNAPYTPYYPALATSYTTDPALSATSTTTAGQACATQVEDGTYCGFINPNDPCSPQPDGYGPVPSPDTDDAFLAFATLHSMAQAAPTVVPAADGTQYTQTFVDEDGSSSANSYMGMHVLQTYDVAACAAFCDCADLCTAFNIYAERDPSLNPSANDSSDATVWGYWCPNPPSMTTFRCTLWGSNLDDSTATNQGGWREQFHVVITASNGYDKTNVTTPPDPSAPCGGGSTSSSVISTSSIVTSTSTSSSVVTSTPSSSSSVVTSSSVSSSSTSSVPTSTSTSVLTSSVSSTSSKPTSTSTSTSSKPTTTSTSIKTSTTTSSWKSTPTPSSPAVPSHPWGPGQNCHGRPMNAPGWSMGSKFFPGPYNPQVCSDYAFAQTALNKAQGKKQACQMFNAVYLHKNGAPLGTYCSLYNQGLGTQWANGASSFWSGRDRYDCHQSWSWTLK